MIKQAKLITHNNQKYVSVKRAVFPFNLILWIFKKTMCKADSTVSMINPFTKNIYTIIDDYTVTVDEAPYISLSLYLHEFIHLCQVYNDGLMKFLLKYLYYNIRYGYTNNPYEVHARQDSKHFYEVINKGYSDNKTVNITDINIKDNHIYKIFFNDDDSITLEYSKDEK